MARAAKIRRVTPLVDTERGIYGSGFDSARGGFKTIHIGAQSYPAEQIRAFPDLLEMTKLLERSLVYEIKKSEHEGDDEGARLKSFTLAQVRAVIASASKSSVRR